MQHAPALNGRTSAAAAVQMRGLRWSNNSQEMAGPTKGYQCILCHVYVLYAALCILYPVYNIQPYTYCTDTAVGLYSVHL